MERKRRFPFGYAMREGRIVPNPEEAKAVVAIFQSFASGATTPAISNSMTELQIPYRSGSAAWNKNMVCRILDNEKYIGADGYPNPAAKKIVGPRCCKAETGTVCSLEPGHPFCQDEDMLCAVRTETKTGFLSYTGECVLAMRPLCHSIPSMTDQALLDATLEKQNEMIRRPQKVIPTEEGNITYTMEMARDMQILDHAISNPQTPAAELLQMAAQCVQNVYACCNEVPDAAESGAMVRDAASSHTKQYLKYGTVEPMREKNPDAAGWKHSVSGM